MSQPGAVLAYIGPGAELNSAPEELPEQLTPGGNHGLSPQALAAVQL